MRVFICCGIAFALITFLPPAPAAAQTGPALLLKPLLHEDENLEARGDVLLFNNGSTDNDGADFRMTIYEVSGRFREQRERLVPRLGFEMMYLDFDTKDPAVPDDLVDTSFAIGLELGQYYDWRAGLTVGVGYAGEAPFGESDAWYGKATFVLGRKIDDKTDFGFVIDYDGARTLFPDIPLPGFAYRHEFDPNLSYTIGAPLSSVTWKPLPALTLDATYTFVTALDARLNYELSPHWSIYGNMETRRRAFHDDDLSGNDRLIFEQRRAELGVGWKPRKWTTFTAAVGYAFSTELSSGWNDWDTDPVADLSDEPYIRFGFESRF